MTATSKPRPEGKPAAAAPRKPAPAAQRQPAAARARPSQPPSAPRSGPPAAPPRARPAAAPPAPLAPAPRPVAPAPPPAGVPALARPAQWLAVPEASLRVKPSLRAAAATFAKVVGLVAFLVALPVVVAFLSGRGAGFLAGILLAQFGLLAMVPAFIGILVPALRLLRTWYELDDVGVRVHSSIVARSEERVTWDKVTLLVQRRSIIDRVLGIESLSVVAYGVRGTTLHLVGLRDAAPVRAFAARKMRESASVAALFDND